MTMSNLLSPHCPVCDKVYSDPESSTGVCGECATGEIYHNFVVTPGTNVCAYVTTYLGGHTEVCNRIIEGHLND
jgi:hypothetical protein